MIGFNLIFPLLDTSFLLKNRDDLLGTKKVFCFTAAGTGHHLAMGLPRSTLLSRLFHEKTVFRPEQAEEARIANSDRCLIRRNPNNFQLIAKGILLVMAQTEGLLLKRFQRLANLEK